MKRKFLFAMLCIVSALGLRAQQEPTNGGVYYVYNTADGKFLTRGNSWGTRCVTNDFGSPWQVSVADNKYTLRMYDIVAGGGSNGIGADGYSDNGSPVAMVPTGNASGYTLAYGENLLVSPATYGGSVWAASGNSTWQFLNASEYAAVLAAKTSVQEAAVAAAAGLDLGTGTLAEAVTANLRETTPVVYAANKADWTHSGVANRGGNYNEGSYGVEIYQGGGSLTRVFTGLSQGVYKVGIKAMLRSASNAGCSTVGDAGYTNSSAYMSANGYNVQIKDWYSSRRSANDPNSTGAFVEIANNGGYYSEVYTYVGSDGTLEIKAVSESYWGASWFLFNSVTLTYFSDQMTDEEANALLATVPTGKMNATVQSTLNDAVSAFESNKTISNYNTLYNAINAANTSVNYYAAIKAVIDNNAIQYPLMDSYGQSAYDAAAATALTAYNNGTATDGATEIAALQTALKTGVLATVQPGDGLDMTAYITNPDFSDGGNGWTFDTPLNGNCNLYNGSSWEYWAGNASDRANASFNYYQLLTGLPAGAYTVSADMFNSLNGEGGDYTVFSPTCGVYGLSSNEEVALVTVDGTELNNYTTGEVLVFKGKMTVGTKNTVTPIAARWFVFDNVKLTYARQLTQEEIDANTEPESITLDQPSLDIQTGNMATLVATILPENATDKTITWTTSDATVATVADGVVTALNAGTATITASANGAEGVTATCTVTVSDAPAPAFYSTTLTAGDYYIVNVATGKFLGGGNDWGTHASIIEHGIPFGLATVSEGVYTLDSYTYNNTTDHYMAGEYIDGGATNLYINNIGGGKFTISTANGSNFVSAWSGNTYVSNAGTDATSSWAQWYFLSKTDRDKALAAATATTPADATYYVKQANISRNLSAGGYNVNAWSQYSVGGTQDDTNHAGQVYNAEVDNYQTIENIPNGTYTVSVQAFTSGTDVKFYANEQEVDVKANDSGAASCSAAAALFKKGLYPNTVTVTVTDRTLKIGFKGDCTSAKWLCYDDFTLYMTEYIPVTEVSASIDNANIEMGTTAQITASTVPTPASFDALSFSSSDESVVTVDENGVVTPVGLGDAIISVSAEMENAGATIPVTVVAPAVFPATIDLSETNVDLDVTNTTATLTAEVGPTGASQEVTWSSSDETVATVVGGVVTAVSSGTATITAASAVPGYETVTAEAIVTVSFPESTVATSDYVNNGAERSVVTYGENLIKNGSFEYPTNNFYGWTVANGADMSSDNFNLVTDGDTHYIKAKGHTGSNGVNSIGTGWAIESGKTYVFGYKVKSTSAGNSEFHKVSLTNTLGTETTQISDNATVVGTDWTDVKYKFTNTDGYAYVQFRARWLNSAVSFDDFYLVEVADESIVGNVEYATAAIPTANIGTAPFQYSQDAIDAANALVQGTASVADVEGVYEALTTVNAPADGQLFNVVLTYAGWTYNNKAMTYIANGRSDAGLYNIQYKEVANKNLAQAFTFTKVSGNNYKMSQIDADGNVRYICTGQPYGGNSGQIRTTTNADDALQVTIIPTATEGVYNLRNVAANQYIGSQDAGVFTVNSHIDFFIVETEKPVITINTTAAGWGTTMLPFAVTSIPEGVKVYSCATVDGDVLTLTEVDAIEANKPYIIEGAWSEDLTGDAQGVALTYTDGLLTGVYAAQSAPNESYVLQKNGGKVGFYQVDEAVGLPTVGANRAYLTAPAGGEVKVFFLGTDADAIRAIEAEEGNDVIYNLAGQRVSKAQKGIFIKNGKKVVVK